MLTNTANRNTEHTLEEIAQDILRIDNLKTCHDDEPGYHAVSVWSVHQALRRAYALGRWHTESIFE